MIAENYRHSQTQLVVIHELHSKIQDTWKAFKKQENETDAFILKLKTALDVLEKKILHKKAAAKKYVEIAGRYENLQAQIKRSKEEIEKIDARMFAEIKKMPRPPLALQHVIIGCMFLLGLRFRSSSKNRLTPRKRTINELWKGCKTYLASESGLQDRLQNIDFLNLKSEDVHRTRNFVREHKESYKIERIRYASRVGVPMAMIVLKTIEVHDLLGGYGDIGRVQRKKDEYLGEIYKLIERRADMNSRIIRLQQISGKLKGDMVPAEGTEEWHTVGQFLKKLEKVVECENDTLNELERLKRQLANMKTEQKSKNTYTPVPGNIDLDEVWSAAGMKVIIKKQQKGGLEIKDPLQVN